MIVYHSAFGIPKEYESILLDLPKFNILRSFHPKPDHEKPVYVDKMFLDSGAFSYYKKDLEFPLEDYLKYLALHCDKWDAIAGPDVIGDPVASDHNQLQVEALGVETIPTFHYGSPISFLKYLLENYHYIALGGVALRKETSGVVDVRSWLDQCWKVIKDRKSGCLVHGFGIGSKNIVQRYPWYSIDSSTASKGARLGCIHTPFGTLDVSKGLKEAKNTTCNTPMELKRVMDWISELVPLKFDPYVVQEPTSKGIAYRTIVNMKYLESMANEKTNKLKFTSRLF